SSSDAVACDAHNHPDHVMGRHPINGFLSVGEPTRQVHRTMLPPLWSHDRVGDMVVTCRWSSSGTATTCQRTCALCRPGDTSSSRSTNFPRSHLTKTPAA